MGEIKSALDIALERTRDISGSAASVATHDQKNLGKKAANAFLQSGDMNVLRTLKAPPAGEDLDPVREGALAILLAAIRLPSAGSNAATINLIGEGLDILFPGTEQAALFSRLAQILDQYLEEKNQMEDMLRQQFLPRLRAKQQEMAKRYGQQVPMELEQDSEYINMLSRSKQAINQKYESVIEEVRARVRDAVGLSEE